MAKKNESTKKEVPKKPKTEIPEEDIDNTEDDEHSTFGNEPVVHDPKPKDQPDRYEV